MPLPIRWKSSAPAGAGDAAYAGLLAAMLRGLPPQAAAEMACAVGACCVEAPDAIERRALVGSDASAATG